MKNKFFVKSMKLSSAILGVMAILFCYNVAFAANSATSEVMINLNVNCDPPEIYDITVDQITQNNAKVNWKTDEPALCQLFYGISTSYGDSRVENNFLDKNHYFNLTQLAGSATYHYKITCQNKCGSSVETLDRTFETGKKGIVPGITEQTEKIPSIFERIADSPIAKMLFTPATVIALLATLFAIAAPGIMNLPLLSLWSELLSIFLGWKKRRNWGVVYESESGIPVPMATVRIFDFNKKKLLGSQYTDKEGRFGFILKPGKYYLDVVKQYYYFPAVLTKGGYHKEPITVKKDTVLSIGVPIDPDMKKLGSRLSIVSEISAYINLIRIPVMILGTILSVAFYYKYPNTNNFVILGLYFILWIYELYQLTQMNSYGTVLKSDDKKPIDLSIIRVYDEATGKLVATRVSDIKGRYFYLINPGKYNVKTTKPEFDPVELKDLVFKRGGVLKRDILLTKHKS